MKMSNVWGHVAQQSRRDKLRVHQQLQINSDQRLNDHNYEQLPDHQELSSDLVQLRSLKYGTTLPCNQTMFSSEMISNYVSKDAQGLLQQQNESLDNVAIANFSNPISTSKLSGHDHVPNCDWNVGNHYSSNLTSIYERARNPMFTGGEGGITNSSFYMRQPNIYGCQDGGGVVVNLSGDTSINIHQNRHDKHLREMQNCSGVSAPLDYQNTLQDVVTNCVSFGNMEPSASSNMSLDRQIETFRHWDGCSTQGLSLSLSTLPLSNTCDQGHFGERRNVLSNIPMDHSKQLNFNNLCSSSRYASGPLGPFTGYATILKNSKYLKPTLQLLDQLCGVNGQKEMEICRIYSDKISEKFGISGNIVVDAVESMDGAEGGDRAGAPSSTFYNSNRVSGDATRGEGSSGGCYRPEYHQKKANLLYMQDEIRRKYKLYQQQMEMVVSSFQSVDGLSAATPYISVALKTISTHFRCLKKAISEELKHNGKEFGQDLSLPSAGTSNTTKGDTSTSSMFKFNNHHHHHHHHNLLKQKSVGRNLTLFEPQPPVWRPQRGLPERSVAVLKAWLFDHFLHPYPTDTDKHMLANQTGLTRNQVSNWFINARVRIWKPMVEEIHQLETKSLAPDQSSGKASSDPISETASDRYDNQPSGLNADHWNKEKRSRIDQVEIPDDMMMEQASLMSFLPYQRGGFAEIGGSSVIGAVSLTLGLTQNAETSQQLHEHGHFHQQFGVI